MAEFKLTVLTPDQAVYSGPATMVTAPGQDGEFGVLANHIPLIAGLQRGVLTITTPDKRLYYVVDGGVLEVGAGQVRVLAPVATPCATQEAARRLLAQAPAES